MQFNSRTKNNPALVGLTNALQRFLLQKEETALFSFVNFKFRPSRRLTFSVVTYILSTASNHTSRICSNIEGQKHNICMKWVFTGTFGRLNMIEKCAYICCGTLRSFFCPYSFKENRNSDKKLVNCKMKLYKIP